MARLRGWRRVATAMWSVPSDPQIYGTLDVDATRALAFLEQERQAATIDHRYVDGSYLSRAVRVLRGYLEDPGAHEADSR